MDKDKNTPRKRSINFQLIEIRTLVDLVLQYKSIIENIKSDAVTWQEKKSAWTEIANKFNATCGVQQRTAENLRLKYECLKKDLRKKAASKKKSMFLTGGGIDVDIPEYVDYEKKLLEILTLSIQGLSSVGDKIEKRDVTTNPEAPVESLVDHIGSEDADNQLLDITPAPLIESHHVEPTVEAVPSCSNTNNINAEQQPTTTLKRKWSPHDLKSKKTDTLHVKKYNQVFTTNLRNWQKTKPNL
ncbi:hypothetical protein RN001_005827 [Aquatica leii]|uniref:Regulatory protein zeste n=1 Tax=Aquatica leii TaxID=1421715 RepID=A0AAN7SPZ4_9COLE|nr:hypothetical protein RN001_005827 [Aquatica leii]